MVEILVYQTPEEAERELKKYDEHNIQLNEEYNDEYHRWRVDISDRLNELKNQKRYFVAELAAFPDEYFFSASSFLFEGENGFYNDIPSLVQGVKDTIKRRNNTYPTIEAVFYTVKNHDERNRENKEGAEEGKKAIEKLPFYDPDITEDEFNQMKKELLRSLEAVADETRSLNQQERGEFIKLYDVHINPEDQY